MKVNATKTTYTVFSLSNKEQTVNLKLEGQKLKQDKCPTYLGITFDPRLTWKHQIEKAQNKGIQRLSILKKLAGTQWGANADILKKTYKGYVRPTLEYGMSAWGSTAPIFILSTLVTSTVHPIVKSKRLEESYKASRVYSR